jgi:hypothetical protein
MPSTLQLRARVPAEFGPTTTGPSAPGLTDLGKGEARATLRAPDTARRTPGIPSRRQSGLIIALGALGGALRGRLGGLVARAGLAEHVDNHEITDHRGGGVAERP